jgi:sugar lactone lactonase YvrE
MRTAVACVCAVLLVAVEARLLAQGEEAGERKADSAADAKAGVESPAKAEAKVETVVSGLTNPLGIAIQPETGAMFVSDSGAGRVCRIVEGKLEEVITGSPKESYDGSTKYDVGPLGIAFVDKQTLAVADGGYPVGEDCIRIYKLPEDGKKLEHAKDAETKIGPVAAADDAKPEGNFLAIAIGKGGLYATSEGDESKGWVLKSELKGTKFGDLGRAIATQEATNVKGPVGLAISSRGEVVVGQRGATDKPHDSCLTFYSAKTGRMILNLETGLNDISAVAYSPKTGLLYATDFAATEPGEAGLYRLDSDNSNGEQKVKATKIAKLDKPTALAFDKDGTAYVAQFGTAAEGNNQPAGSIVKVPGL